MNRYTEEKKDEDVKYKDDIKNNNAINNKVSIHSNKIKTEIDKEKIKMLVFGLDPLRGP